MSARIEDAVHGTFKASARRESAALDVTDPTEDLANEITSELTPAPSVARTPSPAPIGHGIAEIEPLGRAPMIGAGSVLRDRYVLERELASGGTSLIFRAHDLRRDATTGGGPRVAVKLLRPELRNRPHHVARLQREFRQTQALQHPGVVRFYDLDCDRGIWFIVMELLTGETLGPRLRRSAPAPLPLDEIAAIACAAGEVLEFAHQRGVVHGDVKPDNVFITASGKVRVLDFGVAPELALVKGGDEAISGEMGGRAATRAYASPEVLAGERPVPADDVFSLACVICEMAAGRHPWRRRGADEARAGRHALERPEGLGQAQWAAVSAALSWSRTERPAMHELLSALRGATPAPVQEPVPVAATPAHAPAEGEAAPARTRQWRLDLTIGIASLAFLLGLVLSRVTNEPEPPRPPVTTLQPQPELAAGAENESPETVAADAESEPDAGAEPAASLQAPVPQPRASTPPGFVSFDTERMAVSSRAIVAAIPVRHFTDTPRDVEVGWRVLEGSAVAGRDFGGPRTGVARFAAGHTFRVIYIPITVDPRAAGERTFAVELTGTSVDAELGAMRRVLVTILDDA